nr:hypothetical protein [Chlamydiota bacterium]
QTLSDLNALVPNLNPKEMDNLLKCLPEALKHAGSLKKEQAELSSALGNWHLEH